MLPFSAAGGALTVPAVLGSPELLAAAAALAAGNPYGQAEMPGKVWDIDLGAWTDPAAPFAQNYEGNPAAAYAAAASAAGYGIGSTSLVPIGLPNSPVNVIVPGPDAGSPLANMKDTAIRIYGTAELGVIRTSSAALENERSGIRFGTLPRIVMR